MSSETALSIENLGIPGTWATDLFDGKQAVNPLDQWDWMTDEKIYSASIVVNLHKNLIYLDERIKALTVH
jgi:hypothetical protein